MRKPVFYIQIEYLAPGNYPESSWYVKDGKKHYFDSYQEAEGVIMGKEIEMPMSWNTPEYSIHKVWIDINN